MGVPTEGRPPTLAFTRCCLIASIYIIYTYRRCYHQLSCHGLQKQDHERAFRNCKIMLEHTSGPPVHVKSRLEIICTPLPHGSTTFELPPLASSPDLKPTRNNVSAPPSRKPTFDSFVPLGIYNIKRTQLVQPGAITAGISKGSVRIEHCTRTLGPNGIKPARHCAGTLRPTGIVLFPLLHPNSGNAKNIKQQEPPEPV